MLRQSLRKGLSARCAAHALARNVRGVCDVYRMTNARILAGRLAELLCREQAWRAVFLFALADFDRCRAWLELGHSSLFYFLHRELGLSKGSAHYRKTAAELVQRFPEVVDPLRDGRLCITTIVHLAKVMTPENRREMLPRFFHRSKREAREVVAAVQPAAAVPRRDVVNALSGEHVAVVSGSSAASPSVQPVEPALLPTTRAGASPLPAPARRDFAEPL